MAIRRSLPTSKFPRDWNCCLGAPAAAMLLVSVTAGCSGIRPPSISVGTPTIVDRSDEAVVIAFPLEMTNSNVEPLPLSEFRYSLSIDGRPVFSSRRSAQATLRRLGTQSLMLPAVIPNAMFHSTSDGQNSYSVSGKLVYIAPGELAEVLFDTGVRVPETSFSGSGTVFLGFGNR